MNASPVAAKFKAHTGRSCCRCRKDLTDTASIEAGIGPICRKQSNTLLATSISANVPEALHSFTNIDPDYVHVDAMKTFWEVHQLLTSNVDGTDWRKVISKIEWILSFDSTRHKTLLAFAEVARDLGYLGLASLWLGEASTGAARVTFNPATPWGPQLVLAAPRCSAAFQKLRKLNARRSQSTTTPGRTDLNVAIEYLTGFTLVVQTHYPTAVGMAAARDEALAYLDAQKAAKAAQPTGTPIILINQTPVTLPTPPATPASGGSMSCRLELKGKNLVITSPYNAGFIADLKSAVPYTHRGWDGAAKKWTVDSQYLDKVSELALLHYKKQPTFINLDAIGTDIASVMKHTADQQVLQQVAQNAVQAVKQEVAAKAKAAAAIKAVTPNAPTPYTPPKPEVLPF